MLEYAINFYQNYQIIFYLLLIIGVILEGPLIILALSLVSQKLGFSFFQILFFAFLGDFLGDLLHYFFGRFFSKKLEKKDFSLVKKLEKKLKNHKLIDKLIVIKYSPPLTSLGLVYLGFSKISLKDFIKNDIVLCFFSSILITSVGYNFGYLFKDKDNFLYLIILLFFAFLIFYFLFKTIVNYLIKKIYE